MKLKQLFTDDDAVSPVIGVILMVAITVILAAVIATFVLGLGESVSNTAPQASFTQDLDEEAAGQDSFGNSIPSSDGGLLTITHTGGDKLEADRTYVTGSSVTSTRDVWSDNSSYGDSSRINAGNSIDYAVSTDDTVRVIWDNGQGNSAELSKWTGPDA